MTCTIEEAGKETRIEISPDGLRINLYTIAVVLFTGAAHVALLLKLFASPEGFDDFEYVLNFCFMGIGYLLYAPILYFEPKPSGWLRNHAMLLASWLISCALTAGALILFFRDSEAIWNASHLVLGSGFAAYLFCVVLQWTFGGNRDYIVIDGKTIHVTRFWMEMLVFRYPFDRAETMTQLEYAEKFEIGDLPGGELLKMGLWLYDGRKRLKIAAGESAEDLERLQTILEREENDRLGQGAWEFSDPRTQPLTERELGEAKKLQENAAIQETASH